MNSVNSVAPSPQVVTVVLNPALDHTIEVAGLRLGAVNHALRMQVEAGGKAINVRRAHAAGAAVALDTSGTPLKIALAAGPQMVKPNRHELAELVGEPLETREALVAAARALLNGPHAPETVIVSLGGDGALFLTREQALHAHPVKVAVTSTVGAGDAMVAGLVAARLENLALVETAQLATAFSASKLTRLGPHLPPPDQVRALARQVAVSTID